MTLTTVILAPNPSALTGPGTNTYLVGSGRALVCIDPGPDDAHHLESVLGAAAERGGEISVILLTHSHPDHRPLAAALAARTGARVRCHDVAAGDEGAVAMNDGDTVRVDGVQLTAVHTPGHAQDHLCFHDATSGALYTGDHVLSGTTTFIPPVPGSMAAYMDSLRKVRRLQPRTIHPGHGRRVDDAPALIDTYIEHRLAREQQILDLSLGRDSFTPAHLATEIYAGFPADVLGIAAMTVQAHLDKLADEGRVVRLEGRGPRYAGR